MTTPVYLRAEFPPPDLDGAAACGACEGAGLTGETLTMSLDPAPGAPLRKLVVDVLCPGCGGCGRAGHAGCAPTAHGIDLAEDGYADHWPDDPDDYDDDRDDDQGEAAAPCPSCGGRRWWPVQAFGEGSNAAVMVGRVPCGCAQDLLREVAPS